MLTFFPPDHMKKGVLPRPQLQSRSEVSRFEALAHGRHLSHELGVVVQANERDAPVEVTYRGQKAGDNRRQEESGARGRSYHHRGCPAKCVCELVPTPGRLKSKIETPAPRPCLLTPHHRSTRTITPLSFCEAVAHWRYITTHLSNSA